MDVTKFHPVIPVQFSLQPRGVKQVLLSLFRVRSHLNFSINSKEWEKVDSGRNSVCHHVNVVDPSHERHDVPMPFPRARQEKQRLDISKCASNGDASTSSSNSTTGEGAA